MRAKTIQQGVIVSTHWSRICRILLLSILVVIGPICAQAITCTELLGKREFSLNNYWTESRKLNQELQTVLSKIKLNPNVNWTELEIATDTIFRHTLQNTLQHGSKAMELNELESARVSAGTLIYRDGPYVIVIIQNPKIKPFPFSLEGEFSPGQSVSIPLKERKGYQGLGVAHSAIFYSLEGLPAGSTVKWESGANSVEFTLKLRVN